MFSSASSTSSAPLSSPGDSRHRFETKNSGCAITPPMTPIVPPDLAGFNTNMTVSGSSGTTGTPFSIDQHTLFSSSPSLQGFVQTSESIGVSHRGPGPTNSYDTPAQSYRTPIRNEASAQRWETPLSEGTLLQIQYAAFSPDEPASVRETKGDAKRELPQNDGLFSTPANGIGTPPARTLLESDPAETTPIARSPSPHPAQTRLGALRPEQIADLAIDMFGAQRR